jgi:exonuclease VII small subunit
MTETGSVIIESPVGADIFVDGIKVGTVGAPVRETGKLSITTVPTGARVYTKRLADYVYSGLTPQTLTLPASAVPVLVKVTKPEYAAVHDIVDLVPNETVERGYAMERIAIEEPEEATTTLKVMSHPGAEVFLYMEGAEGFISYGRTPHTLTLKARTGAWVPMAEAKRALAETRLSAIENTRVRNEDERRTAMVDAAQEAYDTAKAEREDVESTLTGFREAYNLFQASFNVFFSGYTTFTTAYSSLQSEILSLETEILQLESKGSLDSWEREYINSCRSSLPALKAQLSQLESSKGSLDAEKAEWDLDNRYWTGILLDYEQRRTVCREYEEQMKK